MSFQAAERPTPVSKYEIKVKKRDRRSKFVVKIGVNHTLAAEPKVGRGSYHAAISENVKETAGARTRPPTCRHVNSCHQ